MKISDLIAIVIGIMPVIGLLTFTAEYEEAVKNMCRFERIQHYQQVDRLDTWDAYNLKLDTIIRYRKMPPIYKARRCGLLD